MNSLVPLRTALLGLVLAACTPSSSAVVAPPGPPPVEVAVVTVQPAAVPLTTELPGRVEASRVAEVRARVAGIVLERTFTEGADVKKGEVLYRIDPAPFRAAVLRAEATLARARATATQTAARAERYRKLAETRAVSQQEVDDARAADEAARADVAAAEAALATARLDLGYATVTAPIAGRIGRAEVTEGALVGQGQATLLATIQQLDPVYVNLTQSTADLRALRAALARGELVQVGEDEVQVTIVHEDGTEHPVPGRLLFTDVTVEASTGAVTLRAEVPNPDGSLLPGAFVRARLAQAVVQDGITVPQQAVTRTVDGAHVLVVEDDKVVQRPVKVGAAVGDAWLIHEGLAPGDRVIVEGLQKARPGSTVRTVDWR